MIKEKKISMCALFDPYYFETIKEKVFQLLENLDQQIIQIIIPSCTETFD